MTLWHSFTSAMPSMQCPMDSSPMQTLQHESMPTILPRLSDETPDAGQEDDDSRAGENSGAPCCSMGFIASCRTTQVPASEIGQFALFCQHRSIRPNIGDAAAKGAEVRVMSDVTANHISISSLVDSVVLDCETYSMRSKNWELWL